MVVDEIYDVLVSRFGVGEVFLPKFGKRKEAITWKQFIKATLEVASVTELAKYCNYYDSNALMSTIKKKYPQITSDKGKGIWLKTYFISLVDKKLCNKCNTILDISEFNKSVGSNSLGVDSQCRSCAKKYRENNKDILAEKKKEYYKENVDKILEYKKEYYRLNKEAIATKNKEYHLANKEHRNIYNRLYYIANKEDMKIIQKQYYEGHKSLFIAYSAKRRASKIRATPVWANHEKIKQMYKNCQEGYHVDHIVPLQGKLVCGLHCEFNLQHLPASENLSKGNRFEVC